MKKLSAILLLLPIFLFGQTDLLPTVAWRTYVRNVEQLTDTTYSFEVMPLDWNEAGAAVMDYGNYFVDYGGNIYQVIDSAYLSVTVYDLFGRGVSPQVDRIGVIYESPYGGDAPYLAPISYDYLDNTALDNVRAIELATIWQHGLSIAYEYLRLDTAYTSTGTEEKGISYWDSEHETFSDVLGGGVVGQRYQEMHRHVKNTSGATITNGTPVMFSGSVGISGKLEVVKAIADGSINPHFMFGLATQDILNNGWGKVATHGDVRGINTTGSIYGETWELGDSIFVSAITAGHLTNVKPEAPDYQICVGFVSVAHATNGQISLNQRQNSKITDGADVNGTPPDSTGQIMVWDNQNQYFDFNYNINDYYNKDEIDSALEEVIYYADNINLVTGTYVSGSVDSTKSFDSKYYMVGEVTSAPGYDVRFNFVGVTLFNRVTVHYRYYGTGVSHTVQIQIYNYQTSAWVTLSETVLNPSFFLKEFHFTEPDYISETGDVIVRLYHPSVGNVNHSLEVDYIAISKVGLGSTGNHSALNGLLDNDHPQYLLREDFPDSLSDLRTTVDSIITELPTFATNLQTLTGEDHETIITPLRLLDMIQMNSIQSYGEEEDLYMVGRKITTDSLIICAIRAACGQVEVMGNMHVEDTLKTNKLQLLGGFTSGYYLKVDALGNVTASAISGAMIYKGIWNANTNTPTLADGTGTNGWYYRVVVGDTIDLGSGDIIFLGGDDVLYNGSTWEKVPGVGYTLQAATTEDLGGVIIGDNINVDVDGVISTHAQQNISTNGVAGVITISNGSTITLNVNDADANNTNELQDISLARDTIFITQKTSYASLTYILDSINNAYDSLTTHRIELNELRSDLTDSVSYLVNIIQLNKDSLRDEIDTLSTGIYTFAGQLKEDVYDSLFAHLGRIVALEDSVSWIADTTRSHNHRIIALVDSIGGHKAILNNHEGRLDDLEALDIIEGVDLQGIRDSLKFHTDSLIIAFDSISNHRTELNDLSDSIDVNRGLIDALFDSTSAYRDSINTLSLTAGSKADTTITNDLYDSITNVAESIPEFSSTLEAITGTQRNTIIHPKHLKGMMELSYVPFYGAKDNLYMPDFDIEGDTVVSKIFRVNNDQYVLGEFVTVGSNGVLITTQIDTADIVGLEDYIDLRTDSTSESLISIMNDTLQYYLLISDLSGLRDSTSTLYDSLAYYATKQELSDSTIMLLDSVYNHRAEIEVLKDSSISYNSRIQSLEGIDHGDFLLKVDFVDSLGNYKLTDIDSTGFTIKEAQISDLQDYLLGSDTIALRSDIVLIIARNEGQSDSISYLYAWNEDQSDTISILLVDNEEQADSIAILWGWNIDLSDSIAWISDTTYQHNLRLIAIESDTAYWNDKVGQAQLADTTTMLIGLINDVSAEAVREASTLSAITGQKDSVYISPRNFIDIVKMLSFQNYGQLEDVYAPDIDLTIDTLNVGIDDGFAMIESGKLISKTSKTSYTGSVNGTNKDFVITAVPVELDVYLNGIFQIETVDYTISSTTITFTNAPYTGDYLTIKYK